MVFWDFGWISILLLIKIFFENNILDIYVNVSVGEIKFDFFYNCKI